LGIAVRSMGPQSRPEVLLACVRAAEAAGLADVWVQDHLAIPPDDAEGSGGRYLDPLTALAWLAGRTERIGLGTGVLNLPYRPALPTAKAIATVQELSGGRLRLGVGVGWMEPEFRALGVPRSERGRRSDTVLDFLHRAFASDVVVEHEQPFLFLPRPARPARGRVRPTRRADRGVRGLRSARTRARARPGRRIARGGRRPAGGGRALCRRGRVRAPRRISRGGRSAGDQRSAASVSSTTLPVGSRRIARATPSGPRPGPNTNAQPRARSRSTACSKSAVCSAMWGP